MELTGIERMQNILKRKPVDRIGLFEHFWSTTQRKWTRDGFIKKGENLADHFGFDMETFWPFNFVADLDFKPEVVEETEETILIRDGNGALLRSHKLHDSTPEHVDFLVKDRKSFEEYAKPLLKADPRRINFEGYRRAKQHAAEHNRFFAWSGVNVFELMASYNKTNTIHLKVCLGCNWVQNQNLGAGEPLGALTSRANYLKEIKKPHDLCST